MSTCQAGDRINNYLLQEHIGTGSFGVVWKARHHVFDEVVAIKIPTAAAYVQCLRREGVVIHGLRHGNIVRALDLDPFATPPYLIMEYVDGPSLRAVIDAHPGGLPTAAAVEILRGVLAALGVAHQGGIIHRDIKPANILLHLGDRDVGTVVRDDVKVADFGLGTVGGLTTASLMQSGSLPSAEGRGITGTLAYMSPEQRDGQEVDARSDLYACGVVLFELLTGVRPQGHDLPSALRPDIPAALDDVFRRCYTRLEKRFTRAADVAAALRLDPAATGCGGPRRPPHLGRSATAPLCKNCGNRVADDDQFCIQCGNQLVDTVLCCPSCQATVDPDDNYCITCGSTLPAGTRS